MDALARLVACREIEDLVTRYCHAFDDQDWGALAELWTEDAAFVAVGVEFAGREQLLEFLTTCLPKGYGGRHFFARTLVDLADDGLSGTARTDVLWIPENFDVTIMARYNDEVVCEQGRWLFRRRVEVPVEYRAGPPPMSDTAAEVSTSTMRA
jgi:uncharacterized protein (TIGR02246 family)